MDKQREEERWRIELADDAKITFTIALHGKHAWEMQVEDSHRYHSINHGWATDSPKDWEDTIAPVLRPLFVKGRSGLATKVPWADLVPMYDPPLCSAATRAEIIPVHGPGPSSAATPAEIVPVSGRRQVQATLHTLFGIAIAAAVAFIAWSVEPTVGKTASPSSLDPLGMMITTTNLPEVHYKDYSTVY
jgi:hypothetical protein